MIYYYSLPKLQVVRTAYPSPCFPSKRSEIHRAFWWKVPKNASGLSPFSAENEAWSSTVWKVDRLYLWYPKNINSGKAHSKICHYLPPIYVIVFSTCSTCISQCLLLSRTPDSTDFHILRLSTCELIATNFYEICRSVTKQLNCSWKKLVWGICGTHWNAPNNPRAVFP